MKKLYNHLSMLSALITLILLFSNSHYAQSKAGVKSGVNLSNIKANVNLHHHSLFSGGIFINYSFSPDLSLQFEGLYIQEGSKQVSDPVNPDVDISLSKVEFPILLKYEFGKQIKGYALGGPAFGIITNAEMEFSIPGLSVAADVKDVTQNFDFGVYVGGGISYEFSQFEIFAECRYRFGFINLQKGGNVTLTQGDFEETLILDKTDHQYWTRGLQIMAGIAIPF